MRERVPIRRRSLTRRERAALWLKQGGLCGCGCGARLVAGQTIDEHTIPVALGNTEKPDAIWTAACARQKTSTEDAPRIAKSRRQAGETGQQARRARGKTKKIPARPFPKGKRKMPSRPFPKRPRPS